MGKSLILKGLSRSKYFRKDTLSLIIIKLVELNYFGFFGIS